jgi:hypothetical protein
MGKTELSRRIYKLKKERQLVEAHCLSLGAQLPLWLSLRYTKCGKKVCKCLKGEPHGPFTYLSFKKKGKLCYRYISARKLAPLRQGIANYHAFQEKLARLNKIHSELLFLLKENQKNNLLPLALLHQE